MKIHVVKKHNAGKGCFVCGIHNPFGLHTDFYELEDGSLAAKVTPSEHHQSYPGRLHGGVSAARANRGGARKRGRAAAGAPSAGRPSKRAQ